MLNAAPGLLGKLLCKNTPEGVSRFRITETEAYRGEEDAACHARAGKTKRTAVMYQRGGHIYVYLCYGMHYLLNIVVNEENRPEAVLIRAAFDMQSHKPIVGPARLTRRMGIDLTYNALDLTTSSELWVEDDGVVPPYRTTRRVGIDHVPEPYRSVEWRFVAESSIDCYVNLSPPVEEKKP